MLDVTIGVTYCQSPFLSSCPGVAISVENDLLYKMWSIVSLTLVCMGGRGKGEKL